jgi:hypothetical protein
VLPDYFIHDLEAIIGPQKLSCRRIVLRRVFDEIFDLRGRCVPSSGPQAVDAIITPNYKKQGRQFVTSFVLNNGNDRASNQNDNLQFTTTKCTIEKVASFVIDLMQNRMRQQQQQQQQQDVSNS